MQVLWLWIRLVLQYCLFKGEIVISVADIVNNLLFPIILLVLPNYLKRYGKYREENRPARKYWFDKIPLSTKVDILAKINKTLQSDMLRGYSTSPNLMVQMKLLYEQSGIHLPLWHSHQLIAFMAAENISSYDVRLNAFLNNTFVFEFPGKNIKINDRRVSFFTVAAILYGVLSVAILVGLWWFTTSPFRDLQSGLFILPSLIHAITVIILIQYLYIQISAVRSGVKFCRLFEKWLCHNVRQNDADTSRSHKPAHEGSDG